MYTILPCAKINLGLNIVSRRSDGYHDLQTVFYPVAICDRISIISPAPDEQRNFCFTLEGEPIPTAEGQTGTNLVVKAYQAIAQRYPLPTMSITLRKAIPTQAGMGGGSADAAFTIRLINDAFHLQIPTKEMQHIAASLGADCPFFITARPAYAEGIGDILQPLQLDMSAYSLVVVKPPVAISTRQAFQNIVPKTPTKCCADIVRQPIHTWKDELHNDFEDSLFPQFPILAAIKEHLYNIGALYAAMSGSGSALFAFFPQDWSQRESLSETEKLFPQSKTWFLQHANPII